MKKVLFVCVENAGRSQMAEAQSAGTMPSKTVNHAVVQVMKEKGIDIAKTNRKPFLNRQFLISMSVYFRRLKASLAFSIV